MVGPVGAHAFRYFQSKAAAVGVRTAIVIVAQISRGREELVDQIAMGTMDFQDIETSGIGPRGSLALAFDHFANLYPAQGAGFGIPWVRQGRGRDQLPVFPIVHALGLRPGPG